MGNERLNKHYSKILLEATNRKFEQPPKGTNMVDLNRALGLIDMARRQRGATQSEDGRERFDKLERSQMELLRKLVL